DLPAAPGPDVSETWGARPSRCLLRCRLSGTWPDDVQLLGEPALERRHRLPWGGCRRLRRAARVPVPGGGGGYNRSIALDLGAPTGQIFREIAGFAPAVAVRDRRLAAPGDGQRVVGVPDRRPAERCSADLVPGGQKHPGGG